ncbi:MAG: hypothetical protein EWV76_03715 [Microcystis novacekii Mn_MB_F_20050700_S1]|uniref:Uncharacterized protein n=1 Tax=Microcystis novacekii Mn_MB_F_20050700_S1D TaxID=2486266 RepID=A0A552ICJ9_9CHRO|nr:MAG: hypothetical protein EWV54_24430 [Microcystis novacekii Mn_MB_F_20050700_S1D]TRU91511.1 MAG: hypothetical protein EWV76_03715 [Microcystis novacekii Mn_MB_F_20050700_S1]
MKTLKELVNFVGIQQGSLADAGYQLIGPWTTGLENVNLLVTRGAKPASMRNIIQILRNLTPITLEAEIIGNLSGQEPFTPTIRLNASGGITWFTTIELNLLGVPNAPVYGERVSNSGGDLTSTQLGPGNWALSVKRSGISNSGFVSLRKQLGTIAVSPLPQSPDSPPTQSTNPPPSLPTPIIEAEIEILPSFNKLKVFGSGFLASEQVKITITMTQNDGSNQTVSSNSDVTEANGFGGISYYVGAVCPLGISTTYRVRAEGLSSKRLSNTAGASC